MTTLDEALAMFDAACPHVVGNPFIPHWPHPKQAELLSGHMRHDYSVSPIYEVLYGGAAGGGKSDALLMMMAQWAWRYSHFRGLLIRQTHAELVKSGALISRALQWWPGQGVGWDGTNKIFRFPNGATVEMGYHATEKDNGRYQGGEWHAVGFDELTHWANKRAFEWLRSRIRKNVGDPIPLQLVGASNPGSEGHVWVKRRFIGGFDIATGERVLPVAPYIRATIDDNPSLDREAYKQTLMSLHPTTRDQLLNGDWDAREPGDYYRLEWFGPLLHPERDPCPKDQCRFVRWWDLAASETEDAARTAGVLMGRHRRGVRFVSHATAFRATPGKRDMKILQQARLDGRHVTVGLEIEGGSGGPAQFETLSRLLRSEGFSVAGARPKAELTDKEAPLLIRNPVADSAKALRASPVASCLERGHQMRGECERSDEIYWGVMDDVPVWGQTDGLRLYAGSWTQPYIDELEGFPGADLKDLADATNGAWAYLEAHPVSAVPTKASKNGKAEQHNVHPEERNGQKVTATAGKDRSGRWRP